MTSDSNGGVCLIRRVVIRNYKSIAACDVELGPLTFLVGPNGSGKSNFLDALRFVSDALRDTLEHALRIRGGIREVLRQSRDGARVEE
jgi:predicted ATPase